MPSTPTATEHPAALHKMSVYYTKPNACPMCGILEIIERYYNLYGVMVVRYTCAKCGWRVEGRPPFTAASSQSASPPSGVPEELDQPTIRFKDQQYGSVERIPLEERGSWDEA